MGLVIPWSFTMAIVDGYSVLVKCPIRQPGVLLIIVVGDWVCTILIHSQLHTTSITSKIWWIRNVSRQVLSILTLAAACSTASVVDLLLRAENPYCPPKFCSRYQISAAMAFLTWFLSMASSLFNLWLLPSLWFSTQIHHNLCLRFSYIRNSYSSSTPFFKIVNDLGSCTQAVLIADRLYSPYSLKKCRCRHDK